jgi:hypothetical protein
VAQEVDPGPPIGLPFEPFQPVDTTLRRPIAPDERQAGAHGRFILQQAFREGSPLLHPGLLHRCDPGVKLVASTLTDHATAGLDLVIRLRHDRIEAEEMCEQALIARALVCRVCQQQACRSKSGSWGRTALVLSLGIERRRRHLSKLTPGARLPPSVADVSLHRHP